MSNATPTAHIPPEGSPQSPVGGTYKTVGSALTVVVVGGLVWGLTLTVIKAVAIFTS
ncbi:hypothetical protein [Brevibacterium marinum]|uniref:Uncharacterized protein n=1 Tax=Brevibacterium marinum TaxID=418643 RepID=A0A846RNW3_9MICO|nr:hypothetical protein [Brevibacterium marinum]NJC55439.1 hypothetical protein [Brevibacterium marinum]